ncbi:MAG: hypothetical protein ACMG6E_08925, partial [Candidatus Roizmanbacteria bacterium]
MDERLEVPDLDDLHAVLCAARLAEVLVHSHRYEQLESLLIVDELVHVVSLRVDLELALHLQALRQVEVLVHVACCVALGLHLLSAQEQEEHIQINHLQHYDILDRLDRRGSH